MARISGVELNDNWKVDFALTHIKGIGWSTAKKITSDAKIGSDKRISDLSTDDMSLLAGKLEGYTTEGDLMRKVRADVERLKNIGSYRGMRHSRGLPSRGQRTKSNARTKRGAKKTVGSFKKDILTKMQTNAPKEKE